MSATFTSVIVLEEAIRPGTEDIGFYAQMTAADTRGVTEFEIMQAVCEKLAGREVADEFVNYMLRTANGIGVKGDDFGRLEVFTVDDMRRHHMPKTIYVEVYYPDPECDMPERYADEVDDWDDPCHEEYLQDEQTAREAEAQASASELEAEGFTIEDVDPDADVEWIEPDADDDYSFEKRVRLDANKFYQVQIRILPVADWEPDDGWRTVYITSIYQHAIERLSREPGRDVDSDDLPF